MTRRAFAQLLIALLAAGALGVGSTLAVAQQPTIRGLTSAKSGVTMPRLPPPPAAAVASAAAFRQDTKCASCHSTKAWDLAAFDHDKTGFPLRGAHAGAECKECHTASLEAPLSRACAGCHQDVHQGEFGHQCQGCHSEQNWLPLFNVDAHRRTNFPLVGRHAAIPCTECHTDMTNRGFARETVNCLNCHQNAYQATAATQVNHVQMGFGTACGACHTGLAWQGAHFPEHDSCFLINSGSHSGIACLTCHSNLFRARPTGTCNTNTETCTSCHAHLCAAMDAQHTPAKLAAAGLTDPSAYSCKDLKCYQCHLEKL